MKQEIPAPNYTQIPNAVLDRMDEMDNQTFRVVVAICRQTFGWQKQYDKVSVSTLMTMTGLSRQGVQNGIENGMELGFISRRAVSKHTYDGYYYRVNIAAKVCNDVEHPEPGGMQRSSTGVCNDVEQGVCNVVASQKKELNKTKESKCVSTNNVPAHAEPTAAPADSQSHTQHPTQVRPSRIPPAAPPTQTGVLTPDRQALLDAVLEVSGKATLYRMGRVSNSWKSQLANFLAMLTDEGQTPDDVQAYRAKLPAFLNKPPDDVSPPQPGQMMDNWHAVMKFNPQRKTNGTHQNNGHLPHPAQRSGNGYRTAAERRSDLWEQAGADLIAGAEIINRARTASAGAS